MLDGVVDAAIGLFWCFMICTPSAPPTSLQQALDFATVDWNAVASVSADLLNRFEKTHLHAIRQIHPVSMREQEH